MSRMGSEISRLRKEIGMTQKQLAKQVGVSEGYINDVESGKKILNGDQITKINKCLRIEVGKLDLFEMDEINNQPEPDKKIVKVIEKPVQAIWNDALAGVLMAVPIYDFKMDKYTETIRLPIISNKVEGFPKDKVFYLAIKDNDMIGFRICKGDRILSVITQELMGDSMFLVEVNGTRMIRQIKKLDANKLLLLSNNGSLKTDTVIKNDVKVLAKLIRLEVLL